MERLLWVSLGGAFGSGARYLLTGWVQRLFSPNFPIGTLAVNVLGSFLLAVLVTLGTETQTMSPSLRIALTTGVMGGFTTYSTFSYETASLLQRGAWALAAANILLTVLACLIATFLGFAAAKALLPD